MIDSVINKSGRASDDEGIGLANIAFVNVRQAVFHVGEHCNLSCADKWFACE